MPLQVRALSLGLYFLTVQNDCIMVAFSVVALAHAVDLEFGVAVSGVF